MDRKTNHINTAAEKKYSVIIKKLQAANVNTFHMLLISWEIKYLKKEKAASATYQHLSFQFDRIALRFRFDFRKQFFAVRIVRHWNKLLTDVDASSLSVLWPGWMGP